MFAHNVVIRTPLPSGTKDNQKYGGNLHADWADFTVKPFIGGKHFPMAIQSVWAIEEFTRETGGPFIWPGTHLSLQVPPEERMRCRRAGSSPSARRVGCHVG